jgi:hypothetical protein
VTDRWISLRTPQDGRVRTGRAPLDAATTEALLRAARSVRSQPPRKGIEPRFSVYVVLLERDDSAHELYVGLTGLTPDERYRNHKSGCQASRVVRRYGIGLLPALYRHLNPLDWEPAQLAEVELAAALRTTGLRVHQG